MFVQEIHLIKIIYPLSHMTFIISYFFITSKSAGCLENPMYLRRISVFSLNKLLFKL